MDNAVVIEFPEVTHEALARKLRDQILGSFDGIVLESSPTP
jgi:hypothetical protein